MKRTFIQTEMFTKQWDSLGLTDEDMCRLEQEILRNPQVGPVVPGTANLRKMRFAIRNKGKRGSTRVCYVDFVMMDTIYLVSIYSKNKKENLSRAEYNKIKAMMKNVEKSMVKGVQK